MAYGYLICLGDKTTCGGTVLGGDGDFTINGRAQARQGDPVTCGVTGKMYQILGGVWDIVNDGIPVAGSLDSFSSCPCHANLIPSDDGFAYESTHGVMAPSQHHSLNTAPTNQSHLESARQYFSEKQRAEATRAQAGHSRAATAGNSLTPELIAVAGSQHDNGSGNKMMFIGQAVRELAQFKRFHPDLSRTLVVFTPDYNKAMLDAARDSAEAYAAEMVEISTTQELIDYINHGRNRQRSPIRQLSLFSHGVPQQIAFGYQLPGHLQMSLDVLDHTDISPQAFSENARLDSYACRTGMGNLSDHPIEDGVQFFPQTNESLAQLLANHLRIKVRAFIRRSDYKNTWDSFSERRMGDICNATANALPQQEWCDKWGSLADERQVYDEDQDFTYQLLGAINPVVSGDTPLGAPEGFFEFLPK